MSRPLFVISADWHLERHAWAKHPELTGDAYFGLKQLIDYCVAHSLPLVAAGDLFEKSYPDSLSVSVAHKEMSRMEDAALPVYFVQGQHEMTREQPWLGIHPWPQHVHKKVFEIGDYVLYGLDYQRADLVLNSLKEIPAAADILVAHQVWQDFMGSITKPECTSTDVPHVNYVVTGDFHKLVLSNGVGANQQSLKMISPGPLCLQSTSEPVDKFFLVFHEDGYVEKHQLKTRPFYKHILEQGIDWSAWEDFLNEECKPDLTLPAHLQKPAMYIRYPADLGNAYANITKLTGDKYHLFLNPVSDSLPEVTLTDAEDRKDQLDTDLKGCLARTLDAMFGAETKKRANVYACALQLLDTPNESSLKEELQCMELEFLKLDLHTRRS